MMNACKATILILATCLAVSGYRAINPTTPAGKPPVEKEILLSTGSATLAQELEKTKPLVNLNQEE
jgi:hypothetical protein